MSVVALGFLAAFACAVLVLQVFNNTDVGGPRGAPLASYGFRVLHLQLAPELLAATLRSSHLFEIAAFACLTCLVLAASPNVSRFTLDAPSAQLIARSPMVLLSCAVLVVGVAARLFAARNVVDLAVIAAAGLILVGVWRRTVTAPSNLAWRIAALALTPRLMAAVALHLYVVPTNPRAVILDDESAYDFAARMLAGLLPSDAPTLTLPGSLGHLDGVHMTALAGLYWLTDGSTLSARVMGGLLGSGAAVLAAALARDLIGRRASAVVGFGLALEPGLVVWSTMVLKEAFVTTLVVLVFWAIDRCRRRPTWAPVLVALLGVHIVGAVRIYVGVALAIAVALTSILWLVERLRAQARGSVVRMGPAVTLAAVTAGLTLVFVGSVLTSRLRPSALLYQNVVVRLSPSPYDRLGTLGDKVELVGGEVGGPIVIVSDPSLGTAQPGMIVAKSWVKRANGDPEMLYIATVDGGLSVVEPAQVRPMDRIEDPEAQQYLNDLLLGGLSSAFLAPFNYEWSKWSFVLLAIDTSIWLGLFLAGAWTLLSRRRSVFLPMVAYVLLIVGALTVGSGSPGNLVRQRTALTLPLVLLIAAPALAEFLGYRARRHSAVADSQTGAASVRGQGEREMAGR